MSIRNFKTCGWSRKLKRVMVWECKVKKVTFRDHDIDLGICPCFKWVHTGGAVGPVPKTQMDLFKP